MIALGLTLTLFNNTALSQSPSTAPTTILTSLENVPLAQSSSHPASVLITGRIAPPHDGGNFGFNVTITPPLPFPSSTGYARMWVNDHLLFPINIGKSAGKPQQGGGVPLWIPLPPRALGVDGFASLTTSANQTTSTSSYEFRFEFVCLAANGCGSHRVATIRWKRFESPTDFASPFLPVPASAMIPMQSGVEVQRRALRTKLESGWGTYYHNGILTFVLLPDSFAVGFALIRKSTQSYLPAERLSIDPSRMHDFAIRGGLHSYNHSYVEAHLTWRGVGGNVNVSFQWTVGSNDDSELTMLASIVNPASDKVDASDYVLVLVPKFVHGRAGIVTATATAGCSVSGTGAGLRTSRLSGMNEKQDLKCLASDAVRAMTNKSSAFPINNTAVLGIPLATPIAVATHNAAVAIKGSSYAGIVTRTAAYRAQEAATLTPFGSVYGEVKDATQSSLTWSGIYDPQEGIVFPVTRNWAFAPITIDGSDSAGLFCWDGSFASYLLSIDALDLALQNFIQIVKGRTSAGFVPSLHAGTFKSRDRSNPPVSAKILLEIVQKWGVQKTRWVVELLFEDLFTWNSWWWTRRREAPAGLLSWGSDPYPYAPDGTPSATQGKGGGAASLESGLDNGPVMEGISFNETGLYLQDEYDAGITGLFLMDCKAQIELAKLVNRSDAVATLETRFDFVNKAMLALLWNDTAKYFQNKRSKDLTPVERMAPTHFYPLLAGPAKGPSEAQAIATIKAHLTNNSRFAVWPSGTAPTKHPVPPAAARPLIQWMNNKNGTHALCCQLACNFVQRNGGTKVRYEGMALSTLDGYAAATDKLVELLVYRCGDSATHSHMHTRVGNDWPAPFGDVTIAPREWTPSAKEGGPCTTQGNVSMWAFTSSTAASDLIELKLYFRKSTSNTTNADHMATTVEPMPSSGYVQIASLGWVYPPPGDARASSRYGLPSISKDDPAYIDQNYWHGRTWSPMIQIVYWALREYDSAEAKGARLGLVEQSRALLLKEWRGYSNSIGNASDAGGSYSGSGRYVYENFGADTGEGYGYSSEAQPMYSWGALAGFIGMQEEGFY